MEAGSSYVAWRITGKSRDARCAIEPVSRGCGQGTSRERRTTRAHPPTTEIASSHGARGAAYFLTSPLRAKLSALGRIVGGTSARIASTGSCCAPPHPTFDPCLLRGGEPP